MGFRFILALSSAVLLAAPLSAESSFPEFSAKRVKPPKPGSGPRITVQIAPRAEPAVPLRPSALAPAPSTQAAVAPKAPEASGKTGAAYDWYWQAVSPDLSATGPGRLAPALAGLAAGPQGQSVRAPRMQLLQDIAAAHGRDILAATIGTRVSPALALAVISVESAGKAEATSGAGAQGLMQLMPATAERFGVTDSFDTAQNIRGGVTFLDFLMEKFEGDPILVLAGYNAGENSIASNNGVPPYRETRDYVPKVLAAFQTARGLCMTPPQLVSDGCVFQIMTAKN